MQLTHAVFSMFMLRMSAMCAENEGDLARPGLPLSHNQAAGQHSQPVIHHTDSDQQVCIPRLSVHYEKEAVPVFDS